MERVLVTGATNIGKAGVATIIYKWGQQFNSNEIVYDYLMQRQASDKIYRDAIENKGGIIYTMPQSSKKSMLNIIKWVTKIIKENGYKTIHINSDSAYIAAGYIFAAKRAKIKHIFVHSHCTQIDDNQKLKRIIKTIIHKLCVPYVRRNTEMYLACSKVAGAWMFGNRITECDKYKTIYNGVETERYLFNLEIRNEYRSKLKLESKYVIGNVGRLSYQKNQEHLIDIFYNYHQKNCDSILVIVGEGELRENLEHKIESLDLKDDVLLLGLRDDVEKLLSVFDVLVMPSRFEGLPVTMVEAQMADLPCVAATTITEEADFTGIVKYVEMNDFESWNVMIENYRYYDRTGHEELRLNSSFNIAYAAKELSDILLS